VPAVIRFGTNEWKEIVQEQHVLLYQEIAEDEEKQQDSEIATPWRILALTIHNALEGRYQVALLDPEFEYLVNESDDDSDYEQPGDFTSEDSESSDDALESIDDEMVMTADENPPSQEREDVILMNGHFVWRSNNLGHDLVVCRNGRTGPHEWWANVMYIHYHDSLRVRGEVQQEDLSPWSYDHPHMSNDSSPELGTMRSCPYYADLNGILAFSSWRDDVVVVDLCAGDRIVRRLDECGGQDWKMGDDFVIDFSLEDRLVCHYDLLSDEQSARTAYLELPRNDASHYGEIRRTSGDYSLVTFGPSTYLVHLERKSGKLRVVYQSDRMITDMKYFLVAAATTEQLRVGQRICMATSRRPRTRATESLTDDDCF
jgi:hypothetical protein